MNSRILGSDKTKELVKNATPFNTNIHVNLEALSELPEQFAALLTSVYFDVNNLDDNFTEISGKWMPKPQLMYKIAEARGVWGDSVSEVKDLYEEVNINPMLCKGYGDAPNYQRLHVGVSTTKTALVREDDGTLLPGAPCTSVDSWWNECLKVWSAEKKATEGYALVVDGPYEGKKWNKKTKKYDKVQKKGKHYIVDGKYGAYAVEPKFDTEYKREAYFEEQKNMALNMTQTKAWLKAIREKAGLITAYETKDLKDGVLVFSKIVRSSESLKMESMAHLETIVNGTRDTKKDDMLFGGETEKNVTEPEPEVNGGFPVESKKELTPVQRISELINANLEDKRINEELYGKMTGCLDWFSKTDNPESSEHWYMAEDVEKAIMGAIND
jgi:hypothetical protein